ncbi:MAG: signal recognition particle-docking protein FtsY [Candidatus Marinimicrobia bacterium]|nr:signal recognition particle-docking protein FtsY [Candidatus Neomarinimicrobiota bacterium]
MVKKISKEKIIEKKDKIKGKLDPKKVDSHIFFTLANIISLSRAFITLPVVYYFYIDNLKVAIILLLIGIFSDMIDGYAARSAKSVTTYGKALDPIADKILGIGVLVVLVIKMDFPFWFIVALASRDFSIMIMSMILHNSKGIVKGANVFGKIFIFIATVMAFVWIYNFINPFEIPYHIYLLYFTTILMGISWINYIVELISLIRKSPHQPVIVRGKLDKETEDIETKFYSGLKKTRNKFKDGLFSLFGKNTKIDSDFLDEVEAFLYQSDIGANITESILKEIKEESNKNTMKEFGDIKKIFYDKFSDLFNEEEIKIDIEKNKPFVILVTGINGSGKTTSIGKLANYYKREGKKVLIIAGDTYRAAAVEQLDEWAKRSGVDIIKNLEATNPSGIVFDGVSAGLARKSDVIIVDTAGRLHNKKHLMEELVKIEKVIQKVIPDAPHESLLVIDGTLGQNSLIQAKEFMKSISISGLIMTKLDGTAKGGILIAIKNELNIPVKFIGLGEKIDDLVPFSSEFYIESLFGK